MEDNKTTIWPIVITLIVLIGIGFLIFKGKDMETNVMPTTTDVSNNTPVTPTTENPAVNAKQVCYIWNTEGGDKALLSMDIRDGQVMGEFNWLPAEKDHKTGIFEGTVTAADKTGMQMANVLWKASAEGMTNTEELRIKFNDSNAYAGFGEMVQKPEGIYAYADPVNISYLPALQKTDCGDNAMN